MNDTPALPRVAAMHDISGFGKCALTVALPVLSACGVEVCPLPTAVLSTNTAFEGFLLHDLTPYMEDYITHWHAIGLRFDAFYSGFLGSFEQIRIVNEFVAGFSPPVVVIDPVMGDNGVIYKTYTPKMCEGMKSLAAIADVLTPNLTEACRLAGKAYDPFSVSSKDIEALAHTIADIGAKRVVITGIERGGHLLNCILDENGYNERAVELLPFRMNGTGDLFASVLTGGLLTGHTLFESVDSAAAFVLFTMKKSRHMPDAHRRGVCFEPYLHLLAGGVFNNVRSGG
ncbi:MAG: pyridoxamine kinase [Bacillota bacterium]